MGGCTFFCDECEPGTNTCNVCQEGYMLLGNTGFCIPDLAELDKCNNLVCEECAGDGETCQTCRKPFVKNEDGACVVGPCSIFCDSCASDLTCDTC